MRPLAAASLLAIGSASNFTIGPLPDKFTEKHFGKYFDGFVSVFGLNVMCAHCYLNGSRAYKDKVLHIVDVLAQTIDNDADGHADNPAITAGFAIQHQTAVIWEHDCPAIENFHENIDLDWEFADIEGGDVGDDCMMEPAAVHDIDGHCIGKVHLHHILAGNEDANDDAIWEAAGIYTSAAASAYPSDWALEANSG
jgi:hypothetical protein